MPEYTTLYVGMAVHKDAIAVADVATDHDAQVMFLGTIGTRHADCDQRILQLHSKAKHLVFGPTGGDLRSYVICSISSSEKGLHQRCRLCQLSCP
jgi:hypothetical protein